jgi:hypothetical protein
LAFLVRGLGVAFGFLGVTGGVVIPSTEPAPGHS